MYSNGILVQGSYAKADLPSLDQWEHAVLETHLLVYEESRKYQSTSQAHANALQDLEML